MERRIEAMTSRTAEMTCLLRAASYYESISQYRCNDVIAPILIPKYFKPLLQLRIGRFILKNKIAPKGMYEYVIVRTKYIDEVFMKAMEKGFDQILIFGAGFDSRGIRLNKEEARTIIFEIDAPKTQEAKINQLKKRKITIPHNVVFIPVDFNKEVVRDKLTSKGFRKNKTTLFVMEGLLMYLNDEAVEETFKLISEYAGPGSEIVFDCVYASVIRRENLYNGEAEVFERVKKAKEQWTFGIEKGEIKSFLDKFQIRLIEQLDSEELEQRYFTDDTGNRIERINGTHCLVFADL